MRRNIDTFPPLEYLISKVDVPIFSVLDTVIYEKLLNVRKCHRIHIPYTNYLLQHIQ